MHKFFSCFSKRASPSLLEAAEVAVRDTRLVLSRGVANRVRTISVHRPATETKPARDKHPTEGWVLENRRVLADCRVSDAGSAYSVYATVKRLILTLEQVKAYAEVIKQYKTGNCKEFSVVAFDYLQVLDWHRVGLELVFLEKEDHYFVVMGLGRKRGVDSPRSSFVPNAVICDPWANIACYGDEYPNRWRMKMHKWNAVGKQYLDGVDANSKPIYKSFLEMKIDSSPHHVVFSIQADRAAR